MRPLLAFLTVGGILGGLQLYMMFRPLPRRVAVDRQQVATGTFTVEVTLTFDAGPDAFALDPSTAPSALVRLRGQDVLRHTDPIAEGDLIRVDDVAGVVAGTNEFFVQVTPRDATAPVARAVRVRILRDGNPLADATLWSEPGDVVQGTVLVTVPAWVGAPDAAARVQAGAERLVTMEAHGV